MLDELLSGIVCLRKKVVWRLLFWMIFQDSQYYKWFGHLAVSRGNFILLNLSLKFKIILLLKWFGLTSKIFTLSITEIRVNYSSY